MPRLTQRRLAGFSTTVLKLTSSEGCCDAYQHCSSNIDRTIIEASPIVSLSPRLFCPFWSSQEKSPFFAWCLVLTPARLAQLQPRTFIFVFAIESDAEYALRIARVACNLWRFIRWPLHVPVSRPKSRGIAAASRSLGTPAGLTACARRPASYLIPVYSYIVYKDIAAPCHRRMQNPPTTSVLESRPY
jgi:hypothetical protein